MVSIRSYGGDGGYTTLFMGAALQAYSSLVSEATHFRDESLRAEYVNIWIQQVSWKHNHLKILTGLLGQSGPFSG